MLGEIFKCCHHTFGPAEERRPTGISTGLQNIKKKKQHQSWNTPEHFINKAFSLNGGLINASDSLPSSSTLCYLTRLQSKIGQKAISGMLLKRTAHVWWKHRLQWAQSAPVYSRLRSRSGHNAFSHTALKISGWQQQRVCWRLGN